MTMTKKQIKEAIDKAKIPVPLEPEEIALLISALDSHEYWQLSDESERHDGHVILPEDREGWQERDPDDHDEDDREEDDDDDNHDEIRACRALSAKLEALKAGKAPQTADDLLVDYAHKVQAVVDAARKLGKVVSITVRAAE